MDLHAPALIAGIVIPALVVAFVLARYALFHGTDDPDRRAALNAFKVCATAFFYPIRRCLAGTWADCVQMAGRLAGGTALILLGAAIATAQPAEQVAGEANLQLPDFTRVQFLGLDGHRLLMFGILFCIFGSYGVAWFGIRVNTFANSRTAFASLRGKPFPVYEIPLKAGMSIGMMLISVELLMMLIILLFIPGSYAGPCFIGFAIGESLGAAALRIAGGIFTKIADIGADLMKIVFKIKEDDAR